MSNNSDQPAYPVIKTDQEQTSYNQENYVYGKTYSTGGLTKRELIAAMCLQGILANSELLANHKDKDLHEMAVFNADSLLSQLEKNK